MDFCSQCGRETSWRTNEYAREPGHMICGPCNRSNRDHYCWKQVPVYYPEENQHMPEPCTLQAGHEGECVA